jgi:hypothetical protein
MLGIDLNKNGLGYSLGDFSQTHLVTLIRTNPLLLGNKEETIFY